MMNLEAVRNNWIFQSRIWEDPLEKLRRLASKTISVVFCGERGTGKDLLAEVLYMMGSGIVFIPVECPSLDPPIFNVEFFGSEKGAFTGAIDKQGIVGRAQGGTALLSDMSEIPLETQAKLLGLLQKRAYRRVGGCVDLPSDTRILGTTNRDMAELCQTGKFRADLWDRISRVVINIPSVRERPEDILPLIEYFLGRSELNPGGRIKLDSEDSSEAKWLTNHSWLDNVRGIESAVTAALLETPEDAEFLSGATLVSAVMRATKLLPSDADVSKLIAGEDDQVSVLSMTETADLPPLEKIDLHRKQEETREILAALSRTRWNRKQAARLLRIDYKALLYKMKYLGLSREETLPIDPISPAESFSPPGKPDSLDVEATA